MTVEREITWEYNMLVGDSGVAILLNMMGVFSFILIFIYIVMLRHTYMWAKRNSDNDVFVLAAALLVIYINAVMQELAVGPYAFGLALFFIMLKISNHSSVRSD